MNTLAREILLAFWKVHILHHASSESVYGQWIMEELRSHHYNMSPGTAYPLLRRMEKKGWLKCAHSRNGHRHTRKEYRLTREGARILEVLRAQVAELYREVVLEPRKNRYRQRRSSRPHSAL